MILPGFANLLDNRRDMHYPEEGLVQTGSGYTLGVWAQHGRSVVGIRWD